MVPLARWPIYILLDIPRPNQMERFIDMEHSLCLPVCFAFINLVCVQSVIQLMNTQFVTFLLL